MAELTLNENENIPTPTNWYCPACKRIRTPEYPQGRDTILGVQHGETLVIVHKGLRVEIEAEGRVGTSCRNCGAFIEIYSDDWPEVQKFKKVLAEQRSKGGPPIVITEEPEYIKVIRSAINEG